MDKYKVDIGRCGTIYREVNGDFHCKDKPSVEYLKGYKMWFLNDKRHREDGPAVEYPDGRKYWYINDMLHRDEGPAILFPNGDRQWFIEGRELTKEHHSERAKHG